MKIDFVDLKAQYNSIKGEIDLAIQNVITEGAFIGGDYVNRFEREFAAYLGAKHVIGCANGTDSLEIIMKAMGIGNGDEVIVPALSWFSTSESVSAVGAKPVFVDIEERYFTIDPALIEAKITARTRAIIPVHLYGQAANMPLIISIARKYDLKVIEDCAQSHGAEIEQKKTGLWGDAASFSFYPGKNLGAYGDAGCMSMDNEDLARVCRMIANHGQIKKHDHVMEGRNSRLDGLQAAILSVKLKQLEKWTDMRRRNAAHYNRQFYNTKVIAPSERANSKHVYHLYVVRVKEKEKVMQALSENGIQYAVHYPTALPFLRVYEDRHFKRADFPVAASATETILSIPMFAELTEGQIAYVSEILTRVA